MTANALSFAVSGLVALVAFLFVWTRIALGSEWRTLSAGGLVLGWIPAAIVAAVAGGVAFLIFLAGYIAFQAIGHP